jgi:hypothetical protein
MPTLTAPEIEVEHRAPTPRAHPPLPVPPRPLVRRIWVVLVAIGLLGGAEALNLFIKNGHAEAMKDHAVPARIEHPFLLSR